MLHRRRTHRPGYAVGLSAIHLLSQSSTRVHKKILTPCIRLTLSLGGDDITEMFYVLLQQSRFPYREMDLTRLYDWNLMQDLKHQYCSFHIVRVDECY